MTPIPWSTSTRNPLADTDVRRVASTSAGVLHASVFRGRLFKGAASALTVDLRQVQPSIGVYICSAHGRGLRDRHVGRPAAPKKESGVVFI